MHNLPARPEQSTWQFDQNSIGARKTPGADGRSHVVSSLESPLSLISFTTLAALCAISCRAGEDGRQPGATAGIGSIGSMTAAGATDGSAATEGTAASDSSVETEAEPSGEGGDDATKFDHGIIADASDLGCYGDEGDLGFSYIWIANSSESTVSKIDTYTGVEEGRYRTSTGADNPSRTSVNQFGAVAVGNRDGGGGITKIAAREEDCVEKNGMPGIQTSGGANDVMGFMEDECVLWQTPMLVLDSGPRAIAWEGGVVDPITCENTVPNPRLWVAYGEIAQQVFRLDGDTGVVLDQTTIPALDGRIYGGAVNADGDLWMVNRGGNVLYRVDAVDLSHEAHPIPSTPYGMGVDQNGDPWVVTYDNGPLLDHVYRFDVATASFVDAGGLFGYYRGMNIDREGHAWVAGNKPCRLAKFDVATTSLVDDSIPLPGCETPVGVSIDVQGFVWVVDQNGTAYKLDPVTHAVSLSVSGLVGPYTYSDMTGAGLNLVANPPG